jgi:hypothetical protein
VNQNLHLISSGEHKLEALARKQGDGLQGQESEQGSKQTAKVLVQNQANEGGQSAVRETKKTHPLKEQANSNPQLTRSHLHSDSRDSKEGGSSLAGKNKPGEASESAQVIADKNLNCVSVRYADIEYSENHERPVKEQKK